MNAGDAPISWLMFFTLGGGVIVIALAFIWHLRSQRNRDIAADALTDTSGATRAKSHGALPDLIGVFAFAIIAMGLLAAGYSQKAGIEKNVAPPPVGTPSK